MGETYNIGGHNEWQNIDVVKTICRSLDQKMSVKPQFIDSFSELITCVEDRPGHDKRYAIDALKIESELGWKPQESFESGLEKTIDWYIHHRDWWQPIREGKY